MADLTSIIIPTRNQWFYTRQCLESIRRFTLLPHEVIVIDNHSTDETSRLLKHIKEIRMVSNSVNRGFAASVNQGLRIAQGKNIVLLNNDTLVSHRWLDQLIAVLSDDKRNGVVGPLSNRVIPEQKLDIFLTTPKEIHSFCQQFHRGSNPSKWRYSKRLSGFCMAFRASLVKAIGIFDERFGLGTYEDDDFCHRARMAGFRCVVAGDTYVHHFGSRSFRQQGKKEYHKILNQNRQYYIYKWGQVPHDGK
ncbi:glycosyltransferase family 2 protein [Kroppenstedtia pulmonis]|uniref:Glycosyltransferase family 2 protein n=1 Tax=Kroppenstedtia pulmonis TaxID=1380685 RepID=A0A7D3XRR3_9BACL|nr:glycosyltransferase family 2 protein [Kroppenstedtia pulmonis]QKG84448.1 glycosyltransferase family 2 protein [Kroppenstedtia pulmonis]